MIFTLLVPIYILYLFYFREDIVFLLEWLPFDWSDNSKIIWTSANVVAPILYCFGWLYFNFILAKRFASTFELMQETSSMISAHYILFYGVCALAMLVSFLIPILTPIIGILAFSSLAFNISTKKSNWEDIDEKKKRWVKVFIFIVDIPVIFCSILVIPEIISISVTFFLAFMDVMIEPLYTSIRALGVALPIGNFILLYQNATQSRNVGKRLDVSGKKNLNIAMVEFLIAGFFIFMEYNLDPESTGYRFFQYLYYIGIIFWILSFIANTIQGRNKKGTFNKEGVPPQSPLSLIMYGIFWVATMVFGNKTLVVEKWIRYLVVSLGGFIFIVIFLLIFMGHPDIEDT
jgi:hypothetical protein